MKYACKLSDNELKDLFRLFMGVDEEFISLDITRFEDAIDLDGVIKFPDGEYPDEMIEVDDCYELTDYNVKVYNHSGSCTYVYREYMYKKFGDEYARYFLLGR